MRWRCGNPGRYCSGMLDEDMEAVAKAYVEKDDQRNYCEFECTCFPYAYCELPFPPQRCVLSIHLIYCHLSGCVNMSTCAVFGKCMSANAVAAVTQMSIRVHKQTIGEVCLQCGELAFWELAKGCEMSLL